MSKKVKFSIDFVISDEKKEIVSTETPQTELLAERPDNIAAIANMARARRKKKFIIGLVILGILLAGLGGYGIATFRNEVKTKENIIDKQGDSGVEAEENEFQPIDREEALYYEVSEQLAEFPTDAATRELIERGFFIELDNVVEDGIFKMELVAAAGDYFQPRMLLNIHVADDEIVAQNDKIEVYAYCLDQTTYDTDIQSYGQWNAYGVQDEVDPHVYHVTLPSGVFLSASDEPVVFDMTKIRLGSQKSRWKEYDVSLKETLSVPYEIFCQPWTKENFGLKFESDTKTYRLDWTEIGFYETNLKFSYALEDTTNENTYNTSDLEQWYDFISEVILEINGVEYKVDLTVNAYIDTVYDKANPYYYVWARFPGVTDDRIDNVIIKYRDTVYRLQ